VDHAIACASGSAAVHCAIAAVIDAAYRSMETGRREKVTQRPAVTTPAVTAPAPAG
jgi:hypothetical protein